MSRQVPANGWSERTARETCRTKDRIKLSLNEVPISSCSDVVETISSEPTRFAIAIDHGRDNHFWLPPVQTRTSAC